MLRFFGFNVHEKNNFIGLNFDDIIEYIFSPRIAVRSLFLMSYCASIFLLKRQYHLFVFNSQFKT